MDKIRSIEIHFPIGVELTDEQEHALQKVTSEICKMNCPEDHQMWVAGVGGKMLDENVPKFDMDVYCLDVSIRKKTE